MADDIGKAVEVLQKMLQDDDARENLENIVGQVIGQEESELPNISDNLDLGALISGMSGAEDHRVAFLKALKPYLNVRRQEKVGSAISIMKFVNLSSSLGLMDMLKGDLN